MPSYVLEGNKPAATVEPIIFDVTKKKKKLDGRKNRKLVFFFLIVRPSYHPVLVAGGLLAIPGNRKAVSSSRNNFTQRRTFRPFSNYLWRRTLFEKEIKRARVKVSKKKDHLAEKPVTIS